MYFLKQWTCFLHILIILETLRHATAKSRGRKAGGKPLLAFLLDGFRWDYFRLFQAGELKGFDKLKHKGVKAEYLEPDFPSLSYPNYYSIMTGLHVGTHGMVENYMFDPVHQQQFWAGRNPEQYNSFWWDDGEPLWVTAEKQGKSSYMWFWPGCEVEIRSTRPTFCAPYLETPNPSVANLSWAIDEALDRIEEGQADFAGIYFEQVDWYGHRSGASSSDVKQAIRDISEEFHQLNKKLKSRRMLDDVNIMVFSDHGMMNLLPDHCIWMDDYINATQAAVIVPTGAQTTIWPHPGTTDETYQLLLNADIPNTRLYLKRDIPWKYHYKKHYRVPPILLVADPGYFHGLRGANPCNNLTGMHGYDNRFPEMYGIFMAKGPDFKRNYQRPGVKVTWLYDIMCHVMGIKAAPNEGKWNKIKDILANQ